MAERADERLAMHAAMAQALAGDDDGGGDRRRGRAIWRRGSPPAARC